MSRPAGDGRHVYRVSGIGISWAPCQPSLAKSRQEPDQECGHCRRDSVNIVHVARDRHQKKQVEEVLRSAEAEGCTVEVRHSGHTWGHVMAPNGQRLRVWNTPKDPDVAARIIRRFARNNKRG